MKPKRKGIVLALFLIMLLGCSKEGEGPVGDSEYSGTGSFTFTGDYNESFNGSVSTQVTDQNGQELLPLSFINDQGEELFIGLRSSQIEARDYAMKEIDSEGYGVYQFPAGLYDTGAIGGKGTVTLTKLNGDEIKGTVDMRLARPLNTADTVIVKGSFQLKSQ
jgi:hypothetical protein